jgi:GNAT superfamily N-acetyltransferase
MSETATFFDLRGSERIAVEQDRKLSLTVTTRCSPEFIEHLAGARFGSAGIRYRRLGIAEQIERLPAPLFVELRCGGQLAGTYALATTPLRIGDDAGVGVYRGLLTVTDAFRRRGLGHWLVENTLEWVADIARRADLPVVSWGCIESANRRSLDLLRTLGAMPLGSLRSTLIYRQWPRARVELEKLSQAEIVGLKEERLQSLSDCAVLCETAGRDDYLACRVDGEIVAGARVRITRLRFDTLGGRWDTLYRHMLRYAPPARKRFDPENFTYVRFSDILFKPRHGRVWKDFASSVMHAYGTHMGLFILDPRSALYSRLEQGGVLGRFGRATGQTLEVVGQAWNCDPELGPRLKTAPLAVGPLDM